MQIKQGGFTLLELMITLIILGLMLIMGVPAMTQMIQSSAVRQVSNDLARDMNYARSEATDLNQDITLCRRSGTTETCIGASNGSGWEQNGWLIFVDDGNDRVPDTAGVFLKVVASTTTALITHNDTSGNTFNGGFSFAPDGTVRDANNALATVTFNISANGAGTSGRLITLDNRGNIRTTVVPVTGVP